MSSTVRQPLLAGSWYPSTEAECTRDIAQFIERFESTSITTGLRGGIVPHAGWSYSGRIAAKVFGALARSANPETVILFAGHLRSVDAPSILIEADYWTPLGVIPTDHALAASIASLEGFKVETATDHTQDNSAEVEFPLIRHFFPKAKLVVIGIPPRPDALDISRRIGEMIEHVQRSTVFVGSTDLTHYGPNFAWSPMGHGAQALEWVRDTNDARFLAAVSENNPALVINRAVAERSACCPGAASAAMHLCGLESELAPQIISYSTSADARPNDNIVGYAGVVF